MRNTYFWGLSMNHFGTLSALQPLLGSAGIAMRRCRRRCGDEHLFYLQSLQDGSIIPDGVLRTSRHGYTLSEVLDWLSLTGKPPVARSALALLTQLDDGAIIPNFLEAHRRTITNH